MPLAFVTSFRTRACHNDALLLIGVAAYAMLLCCRYLHIELCCGGKLVHCNCDLMFTRSRCCSFAGRPWHCRADSIH